jgi:hypothetical protein
MEVRDVPDVAWLHAAAMGHSLWAQLGDAFLRVVYEGLVSHPDFLGWVYVEDGRVRGFIAGTLDGPRMMRDTARARFLPLALATVRGLVARPAAARPLLETILYFRRSAAPGTEEIRAESLFCSFEPDLRGRRVSGHINKVLFEAVAAAGHRALKITSEVDNEGAVRQLSSWGFERAGRFRFYGKEMIVWRLDLAACDRLDRPVT